MLAARRKAVRWTDRLWQERTLRSHRGNPRSGRKKGEGRINIQKNLQDGHRFFYARWHDQLRSLRPRWFQTAEIPKYARAKRKKVSIILLIHK